MGLFITKNKVFFVVAGFLFFKEEEGGMSEARMAVCIGGWTLRKERRVAWKEHLLKSPPGPQFLHLSDGFPPSASVNLRSHPRVPEVALGARPEASLGLGVDL